MLKRTNTLDHMAFGKELEYTRKQKGITKKQLMQQSRLSMSQINDIENGSNPTLGTLDRYLLVLGLDLFDIFDC